MGVGVCVGGGGAPQLCLQDLSVGPGFVEMQLQMEHAVPPPGSELKGCFQLQTEIVDKRETKTTSDFFIKSKEMRPWTF